MTYNLARSKMSNATRSSDTTETNPDRKRKTARSSFPRRAQKTTHSAHRGDTLSHWRRPPGARTTTPTSPHPIHYNAHIETTANSSFRITNRLRHQLRPLRVQQHSSKTQIAEAASRHKTLDQNVEYQRRTASVARLTRIAT